MDSLSTFDTTTTSDEFSNSWGSFDFNSDLTQQIVSTFKHILQNLTYYQLYFYNGSSLLLNPLIVSLDMMNYSSITPYSTAVSSVHDVIYDRRNATFNMISDTFEKYNIVDGPSASLFLSVEYAYILGGLLHLGTLMQYLVTIISTLVAGWVINKATVKNGVITDILETVISLLIMFPVLPALTVFILGLLGVRTFVSNYLRLTTSHGKFSLLNAVDGFWAYETFASCSTCLGLYIIEGHCDPGKIKDRMQKTVESELVGGKMNRKLTSVFGFPCWETIPKEEMQMDKYVKVVGGGMLMGEQEVFQVMRSIQDEPIQDMAPWEIYVIPRFSYTSDDKDLKYYAVIYRIHHSIMDGISTGNVLHSVMADKPFKFSLDPTEPLGYKKPSPWAIGLLYFLGLISVPRVTLRNLFLVDNYENKYYLPGRELTGPKTLSWSRPIKMDALKEIKNATHTSVYSVLLSCLGGAFREFYKKTGTDIKVDDFHVLAPIALLPYPDRKPRNRFAGVLVPTNVGENNFSPIQRLQKNYSNMKALGLSSATCLAIANWYFPVLLGLLPLFLHRPLSLLVHLKTSLSNVPGPSEDVFIYDGGKIVDIGIWVPIKYSLGFGMGLFSYKDRVRATVIGDKAYYPNASDVEFLAKAFEEQLSILGQAVGIRNVFFTHENKTM